MPYLPFDLDGKRNACLAARSIGVEPGAICWGLLELWEQCWRTKKDVVGELLLTACFGPDAPVRAALVSFDFLEPLDDGFRVRGAAKWLFGMEGKSRGGKTRAAGVTGRKKGRFTRTRPASSQDGTSIPPAGVPADDQLLQPAASSQQPAAERGEAVPADLQAAWNELKAPEQPAWAEMPEARATHATARLKERPLEAWREIIKRLAASQFARGLIPGKDGKPWIAGPTFLLRPGSATKILEGLYDNRATGPPAAPKPKTARPLTLEQMRHLYDDPPPTEGSQ